MLLIISTFIVLLYIVYYVRKIYPNKHNLSGMVGKGIAMALAMVSSLTIGFLLAVPLQGRLAVSTVLAITLSCFIAYLIGKPFGLLAIIEALAAGLMGGMMGAMLVEMLQNYITLMMAYMDVIYVLSFSFAIMIINREATKRDSELPSVNRPHSFLLAIAVPLIIVGIVTFLDSDTEDNNISGYNHHHMMKE
ncbi:hypothetical protein HNQ34_000324 [Anoxybacillus tepidamans]|uniref:Uncharacterized protein n=1 Tax=Anoxybacteroides tepidamans TaxID=265948 RepID=A0A7W8MTB3_9BACL|nr:hypothetical protein [Anoxybacillus tepidamans]MBB5323247.1 hypothetical protein [Anoxybacillus tepidamans]